MIAIGCFYKLHTDADQTDQQTFVQEILIGTIMSKIQSEGENNQAVFDQLDLDEPRLANTMWN